MIRKYLRRNFEGTQNRVLLSYEQSVFESVKFCCKPSFQIFQRNARLVMDLMLRAVAVKFVDLDSIRTELGILLVSYVAQINLRFQRGLLVRWLVRVSSIFVQYYLGCVERKSAFEHAQNTQIILRMC